MRITFKQVNGLWEYFIPCIDGVPMDDVVACDIHQKVGEPPSAIIEVRLIDGVVMEPKADDDGVIAGAKPRPK